ncbi:MAG: hypothetical protein HQK66_08050 [Desulfamplus sp.]|nr:hypothetical protein [Desulfamplus sp.]
MAMTKGFAWYGSMVALEGGWGIFWDGRYSRVINSPEMRMREMVPVMTKKYFTGSGILDGIWF